MSQVFGSFSPMAQDRRWAGGLALAAAPWTGPDAAQILEAYGAFSLAIRGCLGGADVPTDFVEFPQGVASYSRLGERSRRRPGAVLLCLWAWLR